MDLFTSINAFVAIKQNDIECIEQLLKNRTNPNLQDNNCNTLLHFACTYDMFDIVKLLLEYGADPNTQNKYRWTPLHIAAIRSGNLNIVKLLLEYGADHNLQYNNDWTPLIEASYNDKHDILMLLIDYGADCNFSNKEGKTALDYKGGNFIREYLEFKEHQVVLK